MTTSAAAAFAAPAPAPAPAAGAPAPAAAAPVPAPAPAAGAPAPAPAAAGGEWFSDFANADVKTWTAAKGFKDPAAVAESAYNLEKLIGFDRAGRTLVVPKDDATPAEVAAFRAKLGVPEKAEDYKLPLPEGSDPALAGTIQAWMHKAGATPQVADVLTKEFVAYSQAQAVQQEAAMVAASDKAFAAVTSAWGGEADAKLELGKRFVAQMLPPEVDLDNGTKVPRQEFLQQVFNKTGATAAMIKLFAEAGAGLGEHRMRAAGEAPFGSETPAGAQAKIAALRSDQAWVKKYVSGDKTALAEMTRLNGIAYGSGS